MTGAKKKPSKNTTTGLQSLQELEYFNVPNHTELSSAPQQNVIGIIKISSHQASGVLPFPSGISEAFTAVMYPLQAMMCENLFSVWSPCWIKPSEAKECQFLALKTLDELWTKLLSSNRNGPGRDLSRDIALGAYRAAQGGFCWAPVLTDSIQEKNSFEIPFPIISPSSHGSDPENLGYLFRQHWTCYEKDLTRHFRPSKRSWMQV